MAYEKDIPLLEKKFCLQIYKATGKVFKPLSEFYVSRIDYCYNFHIEKPEQKQYYIDAYKKSAQSFLKLYKYDTTAFFANKSFSVKLYDKAAELQSRKIPIKNVNINNILRFEVEYKRNKIKYLYGKNVKFKDLLRDSVARTELNKCLNRIFPGAEYKSTAEINEILNNRYKCKGCKEPKMKIKLVEFLNRLEKSTVSDTAKGMKISYKTAKRYIKILTELGINPLISQDDVKISNVLNIRIPLAIKTKYAIIYIFIMILTTVDQYYNNDYG